MDIQFNFLRILRNGKQSMPAEKIACYAESFHYKGYVLVNDLYEDSEGFDKNCWMWGKKLEEDCVDAVNLEGLSSNSYAHFFEAHKKFIKLADEKLMNTLWKEINC